MLNDIGLDSRVMREKHFFYFKMHWKDKSTLFFEQILNAKRTPKDGGST